MRILNKTAQSDKSITLVIEQHGLQFLATNVLKRLQNKDARLYYQIVTWIQFDYQSFLDAVRADAQRTNPDVPDEEFQAEKTLREPGQLALSGLSTNQAFDMRERMIQRLEDKPDGKEFQGVLEEMQKLLPKLKPGDDIDL